MLRDVALTGINISKKTYLTARIITICMLINILLCVSLVSIFNSIGAAIAAAVSQLIFFILVYHYAQKVFFIPYEIKKIIILIIVAIVLFAISKTLSDFALIIRLPLKILIIFSFPFVLFLSKFYESIEIERMKQFWIKWKDISNIINNFRSLKSN
ncbi:hypothetical protein ES705_50769 [subsurface metagenome]